MLRKKGKIQKGMSLETVRRAVLARADKAQKTKVLIARLQHEVLVSREECLALQTLSSKQAASNQSVYVVKSVYVVGGTLHEASTTHYATYAAAKLDYSASLPLHENTREDASVLALPDGWQLLHVATWTSKEQHVVALFAVTLTV